MVYDPGKCDIVNGIIYGIDEYGDYQPVRVNSQGNPIIVVTEVYDSRSMTVLSSVDGVTFVDNTIKANTPSDPYETFNGGIGIGAVDYIGSDDPILGFYLKTDSVPNPGTGSVEREYWNGSAWVTFSAMATNAEYPYQQRADNIGTVIGTEQIRIGGSSLQAKTTINSINKYWVRFRISAAITTTGTVDRIKLHNNGYLINKDGFTEYFGRSVYARDLVMHWNLTESLNSLTPLSEDVAFANGIVLNYQHNELQNNLVDGRGSYMVIPEGLDTSKGLMLSALWTPLNNNAGDAVYEVLTYQTKVGDILSTANTPVTTQGIVTIASTTDNMLYCTKIMVDIQNLIPGEILAFGIKRIGNDILDTYLGNIALVNIRAVGYFWKP